MNKKNNHLFFLEKLGFKSVDGQSNILVKLFDSGYKISVNYNKDKPENTKIDYGKSILVERNTTTSFAKPENFVILECVIRLLEKGYKPENIILEKVWSLGHKGKGFLDILVLDSKKKSFLMIECKTWGKEFDEEKKKTQDNGGQLFSYFVQERNTKYLCLYTSILEDIDFKYQSEIIVTNEGMQTAENQKEAFEAWHPQVFEIKGVFEKESKPYLVSFTGLIKNDLKPLSEKDGGNIFNSFAEILRRNVVSDKTNAFNKIFNLFLAKIVDEFEVKPDQELNFQWRENETNEEVMIRLNDLYKRGMELYLGLRIDAVSEKEINSAIKSFKNGEEIKELFVRQKLYSGNEFAFKEVFDKKSFNENCIVVKEIVKLLEKYQIKYSTKQQFLGDFFENLLNTGIKQESGQFFTPIPIAQFICKSLPIKKIIESKNNNGEPYFLPYIIDYASGSGHFLTEIMEEVEQLIANLDESWIKCGDKHKQEFIRSRNNFIWAKEYIYGIEKDYRLAKTTKISTFLNGDGDANIIYGDGLANFSKSQEYIGKLKDTRNGKDNEQFDIVVANPPYSVDGFINTLEYGKESFELYPYLTDKSSEIECLFIERTKQLLKGGGVAGIILPTSIFSNPSTYEKTREIILKYLNIKSIVIFGTKTFMATTKQTVALFLEKKSEGEYEMAKKLRDEFFGNYKDISYLSVTKIFSKYIDFIYGLKSISEYEGMIDDLDEGKVHILFKEYQEVFGDINTVELRKKIIETEKDKVLYFMMSYDRDVVLVKVPEDKNKEREFLGYKFSETKGKEGIEVFRNKYNNNELTTKLFSETGYNDATKVNFYIRKSFDNEIKSIDVHESLRDSINIVSLHKILNFNDVSFTKKITLSPRLKIISDYKTVKMSTIYPVIEAGSGAPNDREFFKNGKYPFIRAGNIARKDEYNNVIPDEDSMINDLALRENKLKIFRKGTILFAKSGQSSTTNNIARLGDDSYVVNHLAGIYSDNKLDLDFLYYYLEFFETSNFIPTDSDYPSINLPIIRNFLIPVLPDPEKRKIVNKMKEIEEDNKIKDKKSEKDRYLSQLFSRKYEF